MTDFKDILPLIEQDKQEAAFNLAQKAVSKESHPFIIKVINFLGAWFGVIFLTAFLFFFLFRDFSEIGAMVFGLVMMAAAFGLQFVSKENIFIEQITTALMFTGKTVALFGFLAGLNLRSVNIIFLSMLILTAVVYPFFKSSIDRFLSCFAVCSFAFLTYSLRKYYGGGHDDLFIWNYISPYLALALLFSLCAFVFFYRKKGLFPMAYGLMAGALFCAYNPPAQSYIAVIFNTPKLVILITAGCLGLMHLKETGLLTFRKGFLFMLGLCSLLVFNIASIMGIVFIFLGKNLRDTKIEWGGYAVFAAGLSYLYYSLHTTLLAKSAILAASGIIVLAAAYIIRRFLRAN